MKKKGVWYIFSSTRKANGIAEAHNAFSNALRNTTGNSKKDRNCKVPNPDSQARQPILTGIRLDDLGLILEGAIPAAVLALLMQGVFELVERAIVPNGLRLEPEGDAA